MRNFKAKTIVKLIPLSFLTILNKYFVFICLFSTYPSLCAQVTVTEFPEDMQLYSRGDDNYAKVNIKGTVGSSGIQEIKLKVYSNDSLYQTVSRSINQANQSFQLEVPIPAALKEYSFKLYAFNSKDSTLIKSADKVLSGDVYVFYGQSNALAYAGYEETNKVIDKRFTRNYVHNYFQSNEDDGWHDGTFPELGSLAKWFTTFVNAEFKVPVLVINGAEGGAGIELLKKRNESNHADIETLYGLLLKRIIKSKVKSIKGLIWFQGETESITNDFVVDQYPEHFRNLKQEIHEDYPPIEQFYVFQLNIMNDHTNWSAGKLREFQRHFKNEYKDVTVIPANGISSPDFDGLHYNIEGYKKLATRLFLNLKDKKGHIENAAPNLLKIVNEPSERRLKVFFDREIQFDRVIDFGNYQRKLSEYFYSGFTRGFVDSIASYDEQTIFLYYKNLPENIISYLPAYFQDNFSPTFNGSVIKNKMGMPAFTFHEVEIAEQIDSPVVDSLYIENATLNFVMDQDIVRNCLACDYEFFLVDEDSSTPLIKTSTKEKTISFDLNKLELFQASNFQFNIRISSPISESKQTEVKIADVDGDQLYDFEDNCPLHANIEQDDFDNDNIGDLCDIDRDGDGINNEQDDCLFQKNPSQPIIRIDQGFKLSIAPSYEYHWSLNDIEIDSIVSNSLTATLNGIYKVFVRDEFGCTSLSSEPAQILLLSSKEPEFEVSIFPNPASRSIKLTGLQENYSYSYFILNNSHHKIISGNIKSNENIDVSRLIPGIYIIGIQGPSKRDVYSKKLVIR